MAAGGATVSTARGETPDGAADVAAALTSCRDLFVAAAIFSVGLNLLMLAGPLYMLQVYDRVLTSLSAPTLLALTGLVAAAYAAFALIDSARSAVMARAGVRIDRLLGARLVAGALRRPLSPQAARCGEAAQDLEQYRRFVASPGVTALMDLPFSPFFIAVIYLIHPFLAAFAAAAALLLVAMAAATRRLTQAPVDAARREQMEAGRALHAAGRAGEAIRGNGMVRAWTARWAARRDAFITHEAAASDIAGAMRSWTKATRMLVQSLILGLGAYLVIQAEMTAGGMIAASIILGRALAPIEQALGAWAQFGAARAQRAAIDAALADVDQIEIRRTDLPALAGRVSMRAVSVAPSAQERAILRDISFEAEPGDVVGVLGRSGAGKSTLLQVLAGLTSPSAGEALFDGARVDLFQEDFLGRQIGYAPQDFQLLDGTVAENIARFSGGSDADVVAAAQSAGVHDVILGLPDGYETRLGDGGRRISTGQSQRIAFARALYGDPQVLLLDEPNANLDEPGDRALAAALTRLRAAGRTVFLSSHRQAIVPHVTKLMVLQAGRLALFGPTAEVMTQIKAAEARQAAAGDGRAQDAASVR